MANLKVVIDRKNWTTGELYVPSRTRLDGTKTEEKFCVLGHIGLACGLDKSVMEGRCFPKETDGVWPPCVMRNQNKFIVINDGFGGQRREGELAELAKECDIDLEFVG